MIYMQLKKYVLPNENDREKEIYKNFKHHFFLFLILKLN